MVPTMKGHATMKFSSIIDAANVGGDVRVPMSIPVPKIGESIILEVPVADLEAWLYMGLARVLGDAHANIKADSYADKSALREAVFAAVMKRFDGGPGGNRAPAGTRDPLTEEVTRIIRAKLKAAKVNVTDLKGVAAHAKAFETRLRELGATDAQITTANRNIVAAAEKVVAARAAAEADSGAMLSSLIG